MTTLKNNTMRRLAVASAMLVVAMTSMGGCYDYGLGNLIGLGNLVDYTGGWGTGGTYWPQTTLYDPTNDIQSVIDYRQNVMDNVATGWDDYIMQ